MRRKHRDQWKDADERQPGPLKHGGCGVVGEADACEENVGHDDEQRRFVEQCAGVREADGCLC